MKYLALKIFYVRLKDGNYFDEYKEYKFIRKPAMLLKLYIDDPKIEFQPDFKHVEKTILNCFSFILKSAEDLPRVEVELFPFSEYKKYVLRTIRPDESLVDKFIKRALVVYESNKIGPHRYLDTYKKYSDFMNSKADQEVTNFLKNTENQLEDFEFQINRHSNIKTEITLMIATVPLNLYCLDCNNLHDNLRERVQKLKDRFVQFCIDSNRDLNKGISKAYEEIAEKVGRQPQSTAELVEIIEFLNVSLDSTIYKLEFKIGEAKKRLMFLLDYAIMPSM